MKRTNTNLKFMSLNIYL